MYGDWKFKRIPDSEWNQKTHGSLLLALEQSNAIKSESRKLISLIIQLLHMRFSEKVSFLCKTQTIMWKFAIDNSKHNNYKNDKELIALTLFSGYSK